MLEHNKNLNGYMEMIFDINDKNESFPSKIFYENNVRISPFVLLDTSDEKTYFLIHQGGGYITNEKYFSNFVLKDNAKATLTTQSSVKIYKCFPNEKVIQKTHVHLGKNASLQFLSDSIIAYETANYFQENVFFLEDNASLIFTDTIGPGWSKDGRHFSFKQVHTNNKFYINNKIVLLDNLKIIPEEQKNIFENYLYCSSLIAFNLKISKSFVRDLRTIIEKQNFAIKFGISFLDSKGLVLRIFANMNQDAQKAINFTHDFLRKELLNLEKFNMRKY